ncbi:MAG: hypothetical protein JEZ11_24670 [Desulfobacterales bacterium]|nr:hypothetical protein [Desulfobacterales bacterium]
MFRQFQIVSLNDLDLRKAHVKAHFRRDPRTGKLTFIQNYDSKVHGKADHEIHAGTKMIIDNPKSVHHGKVADIKGYITPANAKKKPYVSVTVNGVRADLKPHHFLSGTATPLGSAPAAAPAPSPTAPIVVTAPARPAPPSPATLPPKTITSIDQAKTALGLLGLSYTHPDMVKEANRLNTMTVANLLIRLTKIKSDQKVYNFFRATGNATGINPILRQTLSDAIAQELIDRANATQNATLTPKAAKPIQPPAPVAPAAPAPIQATPTPSAAPPTTATISVGDIVDIHTGKYTGQKGKITHMGGKFGVRIKVDIDGTGNYVKIAEYKKPHVSFTKGNNPIGAPATTPASRAAAAAQAILAPASDKTRGRDRKKRKHRSSQPQAPGQVDPLTESEINPMDLLRDRNTAFQRVTDADRTIGKQIGVLPLDDKARAYMQRNLQAFLQKNNWTGSGTGGGASGLPRWASNLATSTSRHAFDEFVKESRKNGSVAILNFGQQDWEAAGYDWQSVKDDISKLNDVLDVSKGQQAFARGSEVCNNIVNAFLEQKRQELGLQALPIALGLEAHLKKKGYTENTPFSVLVDDDEFLDIVSRWDAFTTPEQQKIYKDSIIRHAKALVPENKDFTTVDVLDGYEAVASGNVDAQVHLETHLGAAPELHSNFDDWRTQYSYRANRHSRPDGNFLKSEYMEVDDSDRRINNKALGYFKYGLRPGDAASHRKYDRLKLFSYVAAGGPGPAKYDDAVSKCDQTIQDQLVANEIAFHGFRRKGETKDFAPIVFHKAIIDEFGGAQTGIKAARMKGTAAEVNARLAKKHIAAAKKKPQGKTVVANDAADKAGVKAVMRSVDDRTFKMVERKMIKSFDKTTHGGFGIKVHGVYQVGGMDVYDKHKKNLDAQGNAKFMYHGTDFSAASSIVKTGFTIPKNAKAGRMLGNGVYVTPVSSKAAQYLHSGGFTRSHGSRGVMFVNKCVLGNQMNSGGNFNRGAGSGGYNSIYVGKGQHGIQNEEHCIKDPNSVLPTFWCDVEIVPASQMK